MATNKEMLIHGVMTDVVELSASAEQIDKAGLMTDHGHRNLLDNWYFGNPVNQRGETEYTEAGYAIDRWKIVLIGTGRGLNVGSGFVTISASASNEIRVDQFFEHPTDYYKQMVTASVLLADGVLYTGSGIIKNKPDSGFATTVFYQNSKFAMLVQASYLGTLIFRISVMPEQSIDVVAVKLELGSVQTLAHQDTNGNWVLNDPPPDKHMELLKCCMSTADPSDAYANNKVTPAAINAVNKAGDTMTGNLVINTAEDTGRTLLIDANTFAIFAKVLGQNHAQVVPNAANNTLWFNWSTDGGAYFATNQVLHTGNKPSGSYTGNGSVAERTINIGGVGPVLLIYTSSNIAIVSNHSTFVIRATGEIVRLVSSLCKFSNGVLTLATADVSVNGTYTYYYQVL